MGESKATVEQMRDMNQWSSWQMRKTFIWDAVETTGVI
jgi:hypothetical protein